MNNHTLQDTSWFGINLIGPNVWELIARYGFNFLVAFILIKLIYYRHRRSNDYIFTYFMFNTLIFFVCFLLSSVTLSIGFAFGLFAVFAILRYRTDPLPIKEMTYLFAVITVGVVNALSTPEISFVELLITNSMVVVLALSLESYWKKSTLSEQLIIYEHIENIKPENHTKLMADLKERTGLNIKRFEIIRVDFLRDVARLKVYYSPP